MAKKKKFYVVWKGSELGVFDTWNKCLAVTKGYPGAVYKSFLSKEEAQRAFNQGASMHFSTTTSKLKSKKPTISSQNIIQQSLSVDAACSGNPGVMEYQGVWTDTKEQVFHQKFNLGTNNIGEFLALVHGLAYLKNNKIEQIPIYTDSKIAWGWVKKGKCKTTLPKNTKTAKLYELIERAENWLANNQFVTPIHKWETKSWGEIPADFGRK